MGELDALEDDLAMEATTGGSVPAYLQVGARGQMPVYSGGSSLRVRCVAASLCNALAGRCVLQGRWLRAAGTAGNTFFKAPGFRPVHAAC